MSKKIVLKVIVFASLFCRYNTVQAQSSNTITTSSELIRVNIQIQPILNNQQLVLGQPFFVPALNDSITINRLRFYITDISFSDASGTIESTEKRFFLIDLENPATLTHRLPITKENQLDSIYFQIGVDSTIQMQGAQGGDLDPMHGMYWSWRNGYINFKCEGSSPLCPSTNNKFIFHIGGFQAPFNTIQSLALPVKSDSIVIELDLTPLFTLGAVTKEYTVMSPSSEALTFANQFPSLFRCIP